MFEKMIGAQKCFSNGLTSKSSHEEHTNWSAIELVYQSREESRFWNHDLYHFRDTNLKDGWTFAEMSKLTQTILISCNDSLALHVSTKRLLLSKKNSVVVYSATHDHSPHTFLTGQLKRLTPSFLKKYSSVDGNCSWKLSRPYSIDYWLLPCIVMSLMDGTFTILL